jgi:hypothetical protein
MAILDVYSWGLQKDHSIGVDLPVLCEPLALHARHDHESGRGHVHGDVCGYDAQHLGVLASK